MRCSQREHAIMRCLHEVCLPYALLTASMPLCAALSEGMPNIYALLS